MCKVCQVENENGKHHTESSEGFLDVKPLISKVSPSLRSSLRVPPSNVLIILLVGLTRQPHWISWKHFGC